MRITWTQELTDTLARVALDTPGDTGRRADEIVNGRTPPRPGDVLGPMQVEFIQATRSQFSLPRTEAQAAFEVAWGKAWDAASAL